MSSSDWKLDFGPGFGVWVFPQAKIQVEQFESWCSEDVIIA
jgi:hypothetical protein